MIYITGDTHGNFTRIAEFCRASSTKKSDIMIVLGDAGINYYSGERDKRVKEMCGQLPVTLFCIHGNHENRPQNIGTYEIIEWHGGQALVEPMFPNIIFAIDGEVYEFERKKYLVIGGAYSVDKYYRLSNGYCWFDDEQPSDETKRIVEKRLSKLGWNVDAILSHTCPWIYEPRDLFLSGINQNTVDDSTERWLGEIEKRTRYRKWFCGHFHADRSIDRIRFMYQEIEVLRC